MIEYHVNNGSILNNFKDNDKVVVFEKIKGLYVRFYKRKTKILIGTLEPILKKGVLEIGKEIIERYKINKEMDSNQILYGVIFGKGLSNFKSNKPIVNFYNMTYLNEFLCWKDFYQKCIFSNLPTMSIYYNGLFKDFDYFNKNNYIIRFYDKTNIIDYNDLYKRLFWHPRK